ncbi:hypothetical protein GCM10028861_22540 [Flavobacterium koreense]
MSGSFFTSYLPVCSKQFEGCSVNTLFNILKTSTDNNINYKPFKEIKKKATKMKVTSK